MQKKKRRKKTCGAWNMRNIYYIHAVGHCQNSIEGGGGGGGTVDNLQMKKILILLSHTQHFYTLFCSFWASNFCSLRARIPPPYHLYYTLCSRRRKCTSRVKRAHLWQYVKIVNLQNAIRPSLSLSYSRVASTRTHGGGGGGKLHISLALSSLN